MPPVGDRPDRILIVGMMGSGKTTVARALAARLGWPLVDNDAQIRALRGRDGPTIFRESGEDALHAAEREALRVAIERGPSPAIITVAGSVVDDDELRPRIRGAGHVVWLRARAATLHRRIGTGRGRRSDAVDEAWLERVAKDRASRYAEVADQVVDVDARSVESIAGEIVAKLDDAPAAG